MIYHLECHVIEPGADEGEAREESKMELCSRRVCLGQVEAHPKLLQGAGGAGLHIGIVLRIEWRLRPNPAADDRIFSLPRRTAHKGRAARLPICEACG